MGYPDTFEGFRVQSFDNWSEWKKEEFKPKKFEDRDIDIEIVACGMCGSDIHTATGGWGDAPLPLAVGHEVIGKAVRVGDGVTTVKVGDRVGVGAQIGSCLECKMCKSDNENYCPKMVDTYGAPFPVDGTIAQGGFSSHIRAHEYFTFKIPDAIPTEMAAPMMCAGLTVYSPLERAGTGQGKKVAIIGMGGLGHFAVLWAAAMGAEVTVISHTADKKDDALALGAKHFVLSSDKEWNEPLKYEFDFALNCADMTQEFDMAAYLSILNIGGKFHHVGLPDHPLPEMKAQTFVPNNAYMGASHIGSRPEMFRMLDLAAKQNLKPFIETLPISEANCKTAAERLKVNDIRYRFTLTDFNKAFGTKGFN